MKSSGAVGRALRKRLDQRDAYGLGKYKKPLEPFDGRRTLVDALDEALDMAMYLQKEILERKKLERELKGLRRQVMIPSATRKRIG